MLCEITSRRTVADGVVELELSGPDLPDWTPGSHIDLHLAPGLVRQYSLCGPGFRIAVLREADGRGGSAFVHDRLAVGDQVEVGGPRNHFPLVAASRYLFVAGGIGITPILPMIEAAKAAGADWRLLYGGRSRESMAYLDRLGGDPRVIVQVGGLLGLRAAVADAPGAEVYGCGPAPMLDALLEVCPAAHVERFTPVALDLPERPFEAVLERSGVTVLVPAGTSLLAAIEAGGVDVVQSCREGTCGTCETVVLAGEPEHRDSVLDEADREAGDVMMICVSRARGPRLVLDL
ncbi:PDR/VanB family oxidoreductase [Pseudonocardia kujensis]|uniref:PDR/VanB family oxidoreductase n=1 Tax=Pseudonocardia kujensis TaxID=1128675 RepID=UPI001E3F8464|nr:PDR/VanB family oxidoreductase [Pseudonocardia kujensis]MCE0764864.1 PDR/VanB family oxidoreductase [Pseudonocardia kujensis]